jgi:NAD(P)-dependent dehydrogenase (short-subunit alcohol dehydrogenase family)
MLCACWGPVDFSERLLVMIPNEPVAVVTGATGGIGSVVCDVLSEHFAVNAVSRSGGPSSDHCEVDLLVHCAGTFDQGSIGETPGSAWQEIFEVNLFDVAETTRRFLPALRKAQGRIIILNSTAVSGSPANRAAYAASKTALQTFAQALHEEELENGVRLTSVYLGRVATPMQEKVCALEGRRYDASEFLMPETVARLVLGIACSPPDAHITEMEMKPAWRPSHFRVGTRQLFDKQRGPTDEALTA